MFARKSSQGFLNKRKNLPFAWNEIIILYKTKGLNNPLNRIFLTREIYSLHEKKFFLSRGKNIPFEGVCFVLLEIPLQL